MKAGRKLVDLAIEVDRQRQAKRDFVVDTPKLEMVLQDNQIPALTIKDAGLPDMGITSNTHRQIGARLDISAKYYDKMLSEYPELLATNVNAWFNKTPNRHMIRTLDGNVRAFLSDRYRRIDNYEVLMSILPLIQKLDGAHVESCDVTDNKMYIKIINPKIETEIVEGDVVQSGIVISNSEIGQGSVSVQPLIFRLVCSNGMIARDSGLRKYHTGRINETDANYELYSDKTLQADDEAFLMKVQDTVRAVAEQVQFEKIVKRMRDAREVKITTPDVPAVVELTRKHYDLTETEGSGILRHLLEGHELNLYGLANAVTRHSQDVESYDRATTLEAKGYDILTMDRRIWDNFNKANAEEIAA